MYAYEYDNTDYPTDDFQEDKRNMMGLIDEVMETISEKLKDTFPEQVESYKKTNKVSEVRIIAGCDGLMEEDESPLEAVLYIYSGRVLTIKDLANFEYDEKKKKLVVDGLDDEHLALIADELKKLEALGKKWMKTRSQYDFTEYDPNEVVEDIYAGREVTASEEEDYDY